MEAQGFSKERINSGEHRSKWGWTARMPLPNESEKSERVFELKREKKKS